MINRLDDEDAVELKVTDGDAVREVERDAERVIDSVLVRVCVTDADADRLDDFDREAVRLGVAEALVEGDSVKVAVTLALAEPLTEEVGLAEPLAVNDGDGDTDVDALLVGERLAVPDGVSLALALTLALRLPDVLAVSDALVDWLAEVLEETLPL